MGYITTAELEIYKNGFDLTDYTEEALEVYIDLASDLVNNYIGYEINYDAVIGEQGQARVQSDNQLFIKTKATFINEITSFKVNTFWNEYIDTPMTYANIFKEAWYFYLPLNSDIGRGFPNQDKVSYKISYTKQDKWIPAAIKLATAKVIWNLLRADQNLQNWIAGSDKQIQSFTSWDYTVKLWGSSLSYQWKYNAWWWAVDNPYIDDGVKSLLYKFKKTRQNTY